MKSKTETWNMKASREDKSNITRLARRLRVSESDAVRLAVAHMLQSGAVPHIPVYMRRPLVTRRKAEA